MPAPFKLTFDLLTLKAVSESRVTWTTSIAIMPEQVPPGELMRRFRQLAGAEAYCAPRTHVVSDARLTSDDVCLSVAYIGPKSRTMRPARITFP